MWAFREYLSCNNQSRKIISFLDSWAIAVSIYQLGSSQTNNETKRTGLLCCLFYSKRERGGVRVPSTKIEVVMATFCLGHQICFQEKDDMSCKYGISAFIAWLEKQNPIWKSRFKAKPKIGVHGSNQGKLHQPPLRFHK